MSIRPQMDEIAVILRRIAKEYPPEFVAGQIEDVPRISFHIQLVMGAITMGGWKVCSICDLGGGIGLFSLGCAALGFRRVLLIDDFSDPINAGFGNSVLSLHRRYGVQIVSRDMVSHGIRDIVGNCDAITTFESMEHWHRSPKQLFKEVVDGLVPNGVFVIGVPNCVNLRKRLSVPFGVGKWSSMHDWYERPVFRGHVREPDVDDLMYIARDLELRNVKIFGRNWLGHGSRNAVVRLATRIVDVPLRLRPSLCSNIYLVGSKSTRQNETSNLVGP